MIEERFFKMGFHILCVFLHLKDKTHAQLVWNTATVIKIFVVHEKKAQMYSTETFHETFEPL